jgi:SAM-dependent methyltransferase
MPGPPAGDWRPRGHFQRQRFEEERPTLGARLFRDLGDGRTWRKKMAWLGERLWRLAPAGLYLEIGTGDGADFATADLYPPRRIASDPAVRTLARMRARPAQTGAASAWIAARAEELPFADATFDGVFGIDVLHHLAAPDAALAEMARVLRPGGRLGFVEPSPCYPVNLLFLASPLERGIFSLGKRRLRRWLAAAGLAAVAVEPVPIFFPSFPARLGPLYQRLEAALARIPGLGTVAVGRGITGRKP